jgi:hypothetical protein
VKSISNAVVFEQTGVSSKRAVAIPFYLIVSNNLCLKALLSRPREGVRLAKLFKSLARGGKRAVSRVPSAVHFGKAEMAIAKGPLLRAASLCSFGNLMRHMPLMRFVAGAVGVGRLFLQRGNVGFWRGDARHHVGDGAAGTPFVADRWRK